MSLAVLTYDYFGATVNIRSHLPASQYVHQVKSVWFADLSVIGQPPSVSGLILQASFLARNTGGTGALAAYVTIYMGGATGMPRFTGPLNDNRISSSDELMTATSGTPVLVREVPWSSGTAFTKHDVSALIPNTGAVTPFRFGIHCPAGQSVERRFMVLTLRAA